MEDENKHLKFLLFVFFQIVISTFIIIIFQQTFLLSPKIIIGHLFVVCTIHFILIGLGLLSISRYLIIYQDFTKYIFSLSYGIFIILLYYTYLTAFVGMGFNSRIFTSEMVIGYLKYLDEFINTYSVSHLLIYTGFFIIPFLILTAILLSANFIHHGLLNFKFFVQKHNFNNPPKYIKYNTIVFILLIGFSAGVLLTKHSTILNSLLIMEEPIVSVFLRTNDPFQGQPILEDNEDIRSRNAYPKNINFQKKNVIIIVVDALRSDHLSLYGYKRKTAPFLDSLYSNSNLTKIDTAFSVAGASFAGINSILRSKIWSNMGYNNFSLQQLLKDQGYKLNFLVTGDHTHFYGLKSFYGDNRDFDYYIDGSTTKKYIVNDDRIIFEGLENIEEYNNNPSYFHLHLNSVHSSGIKLDKYKIFLPAYAKTRDIENYTNRYDNGIFQVDDYLKGIFQILTEKGYLKNCIVVITADHGEALGERGELGHSRNVYTDHILIPILIYESEKVPYKNTSQATSVDIAPTIIDRLGLSVPESWEGKSLFSGGKREYTFHQMGDYYAIIHNGNDSIVKYVYNSKTMKEELFDLKTDLYETKSIIDSFDIQYLNSFRNRLDQFRLNPSFKKSN